MSTDIKMSVSSMTRTKDRKTSSGTITVREWRGQRSKFIKRACNRKFRRSNKLNMIVSRHRSIHHKTTEFWWEYD